MTARNINVQYALYQGAFMLSSIIVLSSILDRHGVSIMEVSRRLKSIPPYVFAEIDKKRQAAVARGVDVINLGIGDPDQPTPKHIVDAMKAALDNPVNHHYPPFGGTKEYKTAAAKWVHK